MAQCVVSSMSRRHFVNGLLTPCREIRDGPAMSMLAPISPPRGAEIPTEAAPQPRAAARAASGPAPEAAPGTPNPSLRLDPALGLVVLEFRDAHGNTATLPTG